MAVGQYTYATFYIHVLANAWFASSFLFFQIQFFFSRLSSMKNDKQNVLLLLY